MLCRSLSSEVTSGGMTEAFGGAKHRRYSCEWVSQELAAALHTADTPFKIEVRKPQPQANNDNCVRTTTGTADKRRRR